jgi:hypothetical protein
MAPSTYALHGLSIRSDLPLGQPADSPDPVDVTLLTAEAEGPIGNTPPPGQVLAQLSLGEQHLYTGTDAGDHFVLRIHGLCDFVVEPDLSTITCLAAPEWEPELLSLLARGALLAFILGLGGSCVLHASVVETDAGSVAFVGGSGMGKSTLAGLACRDGARFVSDDLLRLSAEKSPSWVGCSSELRLRQGAAPLAEGIAHATGRHTTVDERVALRPPMATQSTGRIGAVVIPAPTRTESSLRLERIDPLPATMALSAFPRLQWTAGAALGVQFDGVARLAEAVPVCQAIVPWGPPFPDGMGAQLVVEALKL